jgi:hypothetical protein
MKQVNTKSQACQKQIANSLRLINSGYVRTEVYLDFICVDILANN